MHKIGLRSQCNDLRAELTSRPVGGAVLLWRRAPAEWSGCSCQPATLHTHCIITHVVCRLPGAPPHRVARHTVLTTVGTNNRANRGNAGKVNQEHLKVETLAAKKRHVWDLSHCYGDYANLVTGVNWFWSAWRNSERSLRAPEKHLSVRIPVAFSSWIVFHFNIAHCSLKLWKQNIVCFYIILSLL